MYHRKPSSYQWDNMPNRVTQTGESWQLALLMKDVGDEVDMEWGCGSSGAQAWKGEGALESAFGYSSSTDHLDYNSTVAQRELDSRRSVVLTGRTSSSGHAFVAHGYKWYWTQCCGYLSFWIDWGWDGASNGWFSSGNWTPPGRQYTQEKKMLIIRP